MKRLYRITRIWFAGKYKYLKRVNRWMRGRLIRDLGVLMPMFTESIALKYKDENFITIMEELTRIKVDDKPKDSIQFISYDKPKYIENGD